MSQSEASIGSDFEDSEYDDSVASDYNPPPPKRARLTEEEETALLAEVAQLRKENRELKSTLIPEVKKIQTGQDIMVRTLSALFGTQSKSNALQGVELTQVLGISQSVQSISALDDIQPPMRFSAPGCFPHAIALNSRNNKRQYEIEARRRAISIKFELRYRLDGRKATEACLGDGPHIFTFKICYADDGTEVKPSHFTRMSVEHLTEPRENIINAKPMQNGEVAFEFKAVFTSNDTSPRHRDFMIKVMPLDMATRANPFLTVCTPPFIVRSKVSV